MNNIVLGVFHNPIFQDKVREGYESYPFDSLVDWHEYEGVLSVVKAACMVCDSILFLLDGIEYSIESNGYASNELKIILESPQLVNKTVFALNNVEVELMWVGLMYGKHE